MELLEFTLWELVAILGLIQSVYVLVYMAFRVRGLRHTGIAILCFLWLALAFLADFGTRRLTEFHDFSLLQLGLWAGITPVSALLAVQIARVRELPRKRFFLLLTLPFLAGAIASLFSEGRREILEVSSVLAGGVSLLALWLDRSLLEPLHREKNTKQERFWLIISLVGVNLLLQFSMLLDLSSMITDQNFLLIRDILGVAMVYLASTSLFRIYPQALADAAEDARADLRAGGTEISLTDDEKKLISQIENLLVLDKVYQEPGFSRTTLARELNVPESSVSRVVNFHFGKSLPQLLNEKRVEDAIRLLEQTDAPVSVIAGQVGFNSIPSFNRVFRDITGKSPSDFRRQKASG
jgi:AraC-like DNA-binding protein